jgi:hypothetical protein
LVKEIVEDIGDPPLRYIVSVVPLQTKEAKFQDVDPFNNIPLE